MEKVVTIPYGYEDLPHSEQQRIVPICLARIDAEGNEIARGWFDAVSGIQDKLRNLTRYVVQDVRRTSEVVDPAVQTIWRIHGDRFGRSPEARIYAFSKWNAKYVREQDLGMATRTRDIVALETLSEAVLEKTLVDPTDYEALYQRELDFEQMNQQFQERGLVDVSAMYEMVRDGKNWKEIGEQLNRNPDTAQRRFRRWRDRIARLMNSTPGSANSTR